MGVLCAPCSVMKLDQQTGPYGADGAGRGSLWRRQPLTPSPPDLRVPVCQRAWYAPPRPAPPSAEALRSAAFESPFETSKNTLPTPTPPAPVRLGPFVQCHPPRIDPPSQLEATVSRRDESLRLSQRCAHAKAHQRGCAGRYGFQTPKTHPGVVNLSPQLCPSTCMSPPSMPSTP